MTKSTTVLKLDTLFSALLDTNHYILFQGGKSSPKWLCNFSIWLFIKLHWPHQCILILVKYHLFSSRFELTRFNIYKRLCWINLPTMWSKHVVKWTMAWLRIAVLKVPSCWYHSMSYNTNIIYCGLLYYFNRTPSRTLMTQIRDSHLRVSKSGLKDYVGNKRLGLQLFKVIVIIYMRIA